MHRRTWMLLFLLFVPIFVVAQEAKLTTVIVVRHAEKQSDTENPDLSAAGVARAKELVRMLGSSGIRGIYTSQYLRTKETAEPLASLLKVTPVEVDAKKTDELIKKIFAEHAGEMVFVAAHSNTVPEIVAALGASIPEIEDWEYDNLYVVTSSAPGKGAVVRLKYGESTTEAK